MDDALKALTKVDARKAQVVELRFFGGLTVEESAEVLKVSPETVRRDWKLAKVWLLRELSGDRMICSLSAGAKSRSSTTPQLPCNQSERAAFLERACNG